MSRVLDIEPENVKVESLVPEELQDLSVDDFFDKASVLSEELAERLEKAHSQTKGATLRRAFREER